MITKIPLRKIAVSSPLIELQSRVRTREIHLLRGIFEGEPQGVSSLSQFLSPSIYMLCCSAFLFLSLLLSQKARFFRVPLILNIIGHQNYCVSNGSSSLSRHAKCAKFKMDRKRMKQVHTKTIFGILYP